MEKCFINFPTVIVVVWNTMMARIRGTSGDKMRVLMRF
jgi:hypothetical protein